MRSLVTACQLGGKNNCWLLMYLPKVSLSFTIKGFEEQHCRTVQSTIFTSERGILASYRGTNQQWVMKEKIGDTRQTAKKKALWLTMRYRTDTPSRFLAKSTKHVSLQIFTVHFARDAMTSQRPPNGCHGGTYRLRWRRHSPFRHRRRRSQREVAGPGTPTFKVNPGPSGYWQSNNEPLVNIQTTMENHHFCLMAKSTISMAGKHATNYGTSPFWHQLFLWPFSIVVCMLTRG